MNIFISLFKYWKTGGVIILIAAFFMSFYLAKSRGEKLHMVEQALESERKKFQAQIIQIEKARQDERERHDFRKLQNKKIKLADSRISAFAGKAIMGDRDLRDVYERLRQRQSGRSSR